MSRRSGHAPGPLRLFVALSTLAFALAGGGAAGAQARITPPDFTESAYQVPSPTAPAAQAFAWELLDVALLAAALLFAAWLVHVRRSRRGLQWLGVAAVAWFGFVREGCVCPIGAIQNVAQAAFDPAFTLPLGVIAFFFLPLVGTLLFGRVYCAAVCPHGALQDLLLARPAQVPRALDAALGLAACVYLGLAVLFAACGAGYVICEYDPFIAIFRRGGSVLGLTLGALFLVVGLRIGRPYCRWLCPYGVLLALCARVAARRVTIYPLRCVDCRLCDRACPFGAIRPLLPSTPSRGGADPAGALLGRA
ncbi:MAG: 4Fe-4S binding protein, partial [Planctomycetes bacterium]|nr:4Fe-4S binding protein [Planctomycetota bacterium]